MRYVKDAHLQSTLSHLFIFSFFSLKKSKDLFLRWVAFIGPELNTNVGVPGSLVS